MSGEKALCTHCKRSQCDILLEGETANICFDCVVSCHRIVVEKLRLILRDHVQSKRASKKASAKDQA